MPNQTRIVKQGVNPNYVVSESGEMLRPPTGWELLKPGDAALTRSVKKLGHTWTVQEKKGRKMFSRGVWAPKENIEKARGKVTDMRKAPGYQAKLDASRKRRDVKQQEYVGEFFDKVMGFLNFHHKYADEAEQMAKLITDHATPVGSGTVARTERIPIEQRAESAVIAWMRHQTTSYDHMNIPLVKGMRREVRAKLATESRRLLMFYRKGLPVPVGCPLKRAISNAQ